MPQTMHSPPLPFESDTNVGTREAHGEGVEMAYGPGVEYVQGMGTGLGRQDSSGFVGVVGYGQEIAIIYAVGLQSLPQPNGVGHIKTGQCTFRYGV